MRADNEKPHLNDIECFVQPAHGAASHLADLSHIKALKAMQPWRLVGPRSRAVVLSWSLCIHAPWRRGRQ